MQNRAEKNGNVGTVNVLEICELACSADHLLVFIDETGHEQFAGDQPYYALGGCVVRGDGYGYVKQRWSLVRRSINGDTSAPLHAATMQRNECNFSVLNDFFADRAFLRVAAASTRNAATPAGMHTAVPVMAALQEDIASLVAQLPCSSVKVIVESSQRADPMIQARFNELVPDEIGYAVPVDYLLMPKASAEPGLEVADFIINACGSQLRRCNRGEGGFALDFAAVFCRLPVRGCLFSVVQAAVIEVDGRVRVDRQKLAG